MGKPGFSMPPAAAGSGRASTILDCRCWIVDCLAGRHRAIQHFDECGMFNRKWYSPSQEQPYVHCGVVRRSRMDGCGDHRAQGSAPLPASPRRGEAPDSLPPAGEGQGRGGHRARGAVARAGRPRSQGMVIAAWCAMRMTVSREPTPSARGMGKPGFPMPPPAGGCGRAQPSQEQLYVHCGLVRPSRMEGCGEHGPPTSPSQGRGNRVAPCPGLPGFPAFRRQLEENRATRLPHPPAHRGYKRRHPARRAPEQSGRPGPCPPGRPERQIVLVL